MNAGELQAIGAHELGHEYFWDEYDDALQRRDYQRIQELELRCDGIALMTLRALGLDSGPLLRAAAKLTRYNARIAATSTRPHISLQERLAFIRALDARLSREDRHQVQLARVR